MSVHDTPATSTAADKVALADRATANRRGRCDSGLFAGEFVADIRCASQYGARRFVQQKSLKRGHAGFSLIDVLVSVAVIAVLLAVLSPAVQSAIAEAKRVQCASNVRQIGIGLSAFAAESDDRIPESELGANGVGRNAARPQDSLVLHYYEWNGTNRDGSPRIASGWDGLGVLFQQELLNAPAIFYCPAHTGNHPFEKYETTFRTRDAEIVGNYQYRADASGSRLYHLSPYKTLVSNALRSKSDYSHKFGNNMLKADLSVSWFSDVDGSLYESLPDTADDDEESVRGVRNAWREMDSSDNPEQAEHVDSGPHGSMLR